MDAKGGKVVNVSPEMLCWFVNNESMNGPVDGNGINYNKNDNNITPNTIRVTAEKFRSGVELGISTTMILCPAHPDTGDPRRFLEAYIKAESHATGEKQVGGYEPSCTWLGVAASSGQNCALPHG